MNRINPYDAAQCEAAKGPVCHCRCGGALHGKAHKGLIAFENETIEAGKELTPEGIALFLSGRKKRGRRRKLEAMVTQKIVELINRSD